MRNLPIAIKILINSIFFFIYSIFSIFLWSLFYGFILDKILLKPVPWSTDPIHTKIALIVLFLTLIFTIIFRKYFYIKLVHLENIEEKKENIRNEEKLEQDFNVKSKKKTQDKNIQSSNDEMKIYFWKEIK